MLRILAAWKEAGGIWKAVSSRIVTARMKIARQDGTMPNRRSSRGALFMTVISVHAPTHRAAPEKKEEFFAALQETIDRVCIDDVLLLVGDFNARVGSSGRQEDVSM